MINKNPKSKYQIADKSKGFTLMEILIASTIFAAIMIMATGVLAQSSTFRTKLKTMRQTSEESRRIADMITRDIRSANSLAKIDYCGLGTGCPTNYKNGLAIFYSQPSGGTTLFGPGHFSDLGMTSDPSSGFTFNILVIATTDKYIVYYLDQTNMTLHYFTHDRIVSNAVYTLTRNDLLSGISDANNVISSPANELLINFDGYAPSDTATSIQQPIISFYIVVRTKNFSTLPANSHAEARIQTSVAGRSYNY